MAKRQMKRTSATVVSVAMEIAPLDPDQHRPRHLDLQLSTPQSIILHRLLDAQRRRLAVLNNGRYVNTVGDAVRWLLERVADAAIDAPSSAGVPKNTKNSQPVPRKTLDAAGAPLHVEG